MFAFGPTLPPPSQLVPPHKRGCYVIHNDAPQSAGRLWTVISSAQEPLPHNT
jgi:hypothetical protein